MKKMIQFSAFALSGLLFLSPAPAVAQAASPEQVQQFIGNVMNQYATVSGGWFLEKSVIF